MASPIEIIGLVHVGVTSVYSLVTSIKAIVDGVRSVAPILTAATQAAEKLEEFVAQLENSSIISKLDSEAFQNLLADIEQVKNELTQVQDDVSATTRFTVAFRSTRLTEKLNCVREKLENLVRDMRILTLLCEMNSGLVSELPKVLSRVLTPRINEHAALSLINEVRCTKENQLELLGSRAPVPDLLASEQSSFLHYAAGKTYYEGGLGTPRNYHLAARHLLAAYEAGSTSSAFLLGRLYMGGKGVHRCYSTAFKYLKISADEGNADALQQLGICYWEGLGIQMNAQTARKCFQLAADAGSPGAMRDVGFHLLYGTFGEQDWNKAVVWLRRARFKGLMAANLELGRCYQHGVGVEQDFRKAFELFEEVYKADGFGGAYVAHCYEEGIGVKQDFVRAIEIHREISIEKGYMRKKYTPYLGLALIRGHGVEKNCRQGLKMVKEALLEHHSAGWHVLGDCYRYGHGVGEDLVQAAFYYVRGAAAVDGSRGIVECHMALAEMYESGQGLARNMNKAAYHYYNAANRMNATAQWKTAQYYELGKYGFEQNEYRAFDFFDKAARNGHRLSMRKAGEYYMKGIGVPRDRSKGKQILRDAVERGDDHAVRLLRSESVWRIFRFRMTGFRRRYST